MTFLKATGCEAVGREGVIHAVAFPLHSGDGDSDTREKGTDKKFF